jgi:hypothetical protein
MKVKVNVSLTCEQFWEEIKGDKQLLEMAKTSENIKH